MLEITAVWTLVLLELCSGCSVHNGTEVSCYREALESIPKSTAILGMEAKDITSLDLSYNFIESLDYQSFAGFISLEVINISGNPLKCFGSDAFKGCPNLTLLDISFSAEPSLPCLSGQSYALPVKELHMLQFDLATNNRPSYPKAYNFVKLFEHFFRRMTHIENVVMTLAVSKNPYITRNFVQLKSLVMYSSHNWSSIITTGMLVPVYPAYLASKPCHKNIDDGKDRNDLVIAGLYFIVNDTCIHYLTFHFKCSAKYFNVSCQEKPNIFPETFFNVNGREHENYLVYMDLSYSDINNLIASDQGLHSLQYLNLRKCNISSINYDFFNFLNLLFLDVSMNHFTLCPDTRDTEDPILSCLSDRLWLGLPKLRFLYLDSLKITEVPQNFFKKLVNLETLFLDNNWIKDPGFIISGMSHLSLISMRNVHLVQFSESFVNELDQSPAVVDIRDNTLYCMCFNLHLLQWLDSNRDRVKHYTELQCSDSIGEVNTELLHMVNISALVSSCRQQLGLNDTAVSVVKREVLYQRYHLLSVAVAVSCSLLLLTIAVVIAAYRKRWLLQWTFYKWHRYLLRPRAAPGRNPAGPARQMSEQRYHAFVSHNHSQDFEWVQGTLLPKIENVCGLSLCIGQRDFTLGTSIADNIVHAIEHSAYTLIILTQGFLQSHWCDFELQMALTRGHQHVIVIYLEHVPYETLTAEMKVLVRTVTYLEYPADQNGMELFWSRLYDAITKCNDNTL